MDFLTIGIQLLMASLGAFGYSILYRISKDKLLWASLGGFLAWMVYLLCGTLSDSNVVRYFLAAVVVTFYAEFMARKKRTPATIFLAPGTIPLIPGSSLYQTMVYALGGSWKEAFFQGLNTLFLAAAISGGILMTMTILQVTGLKQRRINA